MNHLTASWRQLASAAPGSGRPYEAPYNGRNGADFPGSVILSLPGAGSVQYSRGCEIDPGGVTIHAVYVEPEFRRKGIGTELLDLLAAKFKGHAMDPGGLTADGEPFWHGWVAANGWPEVNGIVWLEDPESFYGEDE